MPQIEQVNTFLSQIFWLVVCFAVLFAVVRTVVVPRVGATIEARRERIEGDLEKAETAKSEAEKIRRQYEAAVADSRAKAQATIRKTQDAFAAEAAKAAQTQGEALAKRVAEAEARIAAARTVAMGNVRAVAADVAGAAAERILGVTVDAATAAAAVSAGERAGG